MLRVKYGDVGCKGKGGSSWEEENYDHDVWTVDGLFALLPFLAEMDTVYIRAFKSKSLKSVIAEKSNLFFQNDGKRKPLRGDVLKPE